ncbi:hypothetical protein [Blastococcus saxobsidens]|uniref:Endonuclease/exonuclease/phosphatase family protein n=1 Tax=Blastococcus saxobsidens (strain DD2) TaxID=1146883 RepID=H6RJW6_BLASD|nr:hypothetical protein [Blastococcus saxobsidens]CCG03619.1 exported protein of unknown function [Blastococcus saxobsidens DD2]
MSTRAGRSSGRGLAVALALALGLTLLAPVPATAATVRLQLWDFNACDQYGRNFPDCQVTPEQRAAAIAASLGSTSWTPNAATLQEMCRSTFDMALADLPPGWVGAFHSTYTTTDTRCQSADPAWGIAVFARSDVLTGPVHHTLGVETSGEERTLLCADVTVGIGMRLCTTHLTSSSQSGAASQAVTADRLVDEWTAAGMLVVVGGDFNLDVRRCRNSNVSTGLKGWYAGRFGAGKTRCYSGSGDMHEADRYRSGGDGVYDEDTLGSAKIDLVFAPGRRLATDYAGDATSSSVSDHDPLRAAFTASG